MSIETAKKTLNRALSELHQSKDEEEMRQSAEKAWRAAREAVYAVMDIVGEKPKASTLSTSAIASFEAKYLGRVRGKSQPLTSGYTRALHVLHGLCFYDAICPSRTELEDEMAQVSWLIEQAAQDSVALGGRRKRKK